MIANALDEIKTNVARQENSDIADMRRPWLAKLDAMLGHVASRGDRGSPYKDIRRKQSWLSNGSASCS
jgi:hypothetical protein